MNTTIKVMKQALGDFEDLHENHNTTCASSMSALREAIAREEARPAQPEDVAIYQGIVNNYFNGITQPKPSAGERSDLIAELRGDAADHRNVATQCDMRPESTANWQHALHCEKAADMLAADAPFAPDWANYRQGFANGKAEALEEIARLEAQVADWTKAYQAAYQEATTATVKVFKLQAELDALKHQEPVGIVNGSGLLWAFDGKSTKDGDVLYLAAGSQVAVPQTIAVTPEMVEAYLAANSAYWARTDELPKQDAGKWRNGTPREATAEGLAAALAAVPQPQGEVK